MAIYKKINGEYIRINPLYVKDYNGNYFDPLGGAYVKQGGVYYKYYPDLIPLFIMGFCDESDPMYTDYYYGHDRAQNDLDNWENNVLPSKDNPVPSVLFMPNGNRSDVWPLSETPRYVDFEETLSVGNSNQFSNKLNEMIDTYGRPGGLNGQPKKSKLYIPVDNSGSMTYSDIRYELESFINSLDDDWHVVVEKIDIDDTYQERWLRWFIDGAY